MSVVDNLSIDQRNLLGRIAQYTEGNRRTDKLSVCMQQFGKHWSVSHTAFVGLSLRALGLVSTYKDANQYARWDVTPLGKAALCELRNVAAKPVEVKKEYAIYDPEDSSFQYFGELPRAEAEAVVWAQREPGHNIHVLQVLSKVEAKLTVNKVNV